MRSNDNNAELLVILLVIGLPMLGILVFSRAIGADFLTTVSAIVKSIGVLVAAGAIWYFWKPPILPLVFATLFCVWPCWWAVLDSIARGGVDPSQPPSFGFLNDDSMLPFWDSPWFKWGIEAVIGCLLGYSIYKWHNDDY